MSESNELEKTVLAGLALDAFEDRLGRKLLQLYHNGILDPWVIAQITSRVDRRQRQERFANTPFRKPRLHKGKLILGYDQQGHVIRIPVQYLNAGALTVGNTGSGKTTLACFYATQMARLTCGMWLTDLRKREFRRLRSKFSEKGIELTIIRSRSFKVNPLQTPIGANPREYASILGNTLVRVLNLPPRASVLLASTIITLFEQYGIFEGNAKYPTLFHLYEAVRNDREANAQARLAILDNLAVVLLALGPEVLGYYRGWNVNDLAKLFLVFELTGLIEKGKDLILNYLVLSEFTSRLAKGISNADMDLWINVDEGQRLFSQQKESGTHGGNSITDLAGLIRGEGTGLYVSVLTPDDLSSRIPSFTSTKIIGRCGSMGDYIAAGRLMGLNTDQINWCVHHMIPGHFVGQVSDGPWRYPFLFRVPKPKGLKPVDDAEADESLNSLANLSVEPVEFSTWSPVPSVTITDDPDQMPPEHKRLSPSAIRLLQAIVNQPMRPSSDYVKLARISPNTLRKLRPIFIKEGLIKEHQLDKTGRGRSARIWEPLEAAKEVLAANPAQAGN